MQATLTKPTTKNMLTLVATDCGPQIQISHPNSKSPLTILIDANGYRCRTQHGDMFFSTSDLARHLAEWFRNDTGIIQGHSNSPEQFALTGIADMATIHALGRLEYLHINSRAILLVTPNTKPGASLYRHTRLTQPAQVARLLANWFQPVAKAA